MRTGPELDTSKKILKLPAQERGWYATDSKGGAGGKSDGDAGGSSSPAARHTAAAAVRFLRQLRALSQPAMMAALRRYLIAGSCSSGSRLA